MPIAVGQVVNLGGLGQVGPYAVYSNPLPAVAGGQRRREVGRCRLHGRVDRFTGKAAHPLHRVHVDDRAASTVDHRLQECPGDPEDVLQVGRVHGLPRLGRRLMEPDQRPVVADVVHQHVDPSVLAHDRDTEVLDLGIGCHVDHVGPCRPTGRLDVLDGGRRPVGVNLDDLDQGTVLREQSGDRSADPRSTTGHHGHPTVQQAAPVVDHRNPLRPLCQTPGRFRLEGSLPGGACHPDAATSRRASRSLSTSSSVV